MVKFTFLRCGTYRKSESVGPEFFQPPKKKTITEVSEEKYEIEKQKLICSFVKIILYTQFLTLNLNKYLVS